MLELKGRSKRATVAVETGLTILDHALKHDVDWGFSCTRGTCARCRCKIEAGAELLSAPNEAEELRLEPDELEAGFRLGCQATLRRDGSVIAVLKPYF
ncbi:2Fe-2S iron-sulfur cluster-binding protein [Paenibacillus koleovorans]|uniref:2Fe-2S iron-sulfur cluster-binding protein n=1 Tax=Paenibacillus koleovorans TaxID=121608 RepID=UPI000FDC7FEB|nr:2Fe-2S iron-sulfur cluster-binding protein [Paenibacillus koleovorans]